MPNANFNHILHIPADQFFIVKKKKSWNLVLIKEKLSLKPIKYWQCLTFATAKKVSKGQLLL